MKAVLALSGTAYAKSELSADSGAICLLKFSQLTLRAHLHAAVIP